MKHSSFDQLVTDLRPRLLRRARTLLDDAAAEDTVSETLVTLWRKSRLPAWHEHADGQRMALAYSILAGHVRNEYRSRTRRSRLGDRLVGGAEGAPSSGENADLDTWLDVARCVAELDASLREAFVLHLLGCGVGESAQLTGVTAATASRRRAAVVERLRRQLSIPTTT